MLALREEVTFPPCASIRLRASSRCQQCVGDRHDDQREDRGEKQPGDHGDREGRAQLGALAETERHGCEAEDGGGGRHEDGAEALAPGTQNRCAQIVLAASSQLVDAVDENDPVVDHDPREHDRDPVRLADSG